MLGDRPEPHFGEEPTPSNEGEDALGPNPDRAEPAPLAPPGALPLKPAGKGLPPRAERRRRRLPLFGRPRLSTMLLAVNLVLLLTPLSGIYAMRLYESALIRQTENGLQSQAAFMVAAFQASLQRDPEFGARAAEISHPVDEEYRLPDKPETPWTPRPPRLDLARDPIRPPAVEPQATKDAAHPMVRKAGEDIASIFMPAHYVTLSSIRVVDQQGIIVASTARNVGLSLAHLPEIEAALRGRRVELMRQKGEVNKGNRRFNAFERASGIRVHVAAPIVIDNQVFGAVLLGRTPNTLREALRGKQRELLLASAAMIFIATLVSLFMGATVSGPVSRLVRQSKQVVQGRREVIEPLVHPVTAEIAELSVSVSAMAEALSARADYISDFAAKVSHEFKTPLTSIQGAVELLRDHAGTMDDTQRERFLANIAQDSERLARLVSRLLELARADVFQPEPGGDSDLRGLLLALVEFYADNGYRLTLTGIGETGELRVSMDADNLASVVRNLIDNALIHGQTAPHIDVAGGEGQVRITVSDDGPGMSTANAIRIFDPFFTTDRDAGGTGLGLSLVKRLVEVHGGGIHLARHIGGCEFVVTLPRALN